MGEEGESYVAVPRVPGTDLVVVEPCFVLAGSETFFDRLPCAGHGHEFAESGPVGIVALIECEFVIVDGSPNEVLTIGFSRIDQCPVIDPVPFRPDTARAALPGVGGRFFTEEPISWVVPVVWANVVFFGMAIT